MTYIKEFNLSASAPLSDEPYFSESATIRDSRFGKYTSVGEFTAVEESSMDDYSYICGYGSVIYTEIGKFSNIAACCRINPGNHPIERPTLHHFTYRAKRYGFREDDDDAFFAWRRIQKVKIGHDTWIGHGVVIMPGVKIGNGSIIGSNSVVTRDVPSYCIAVGSPARIIRKRFPQEISDAIEKTTWWDWPFETIKERFEDFKDLRTFLKKYAIGLK